MLADNLFNGDILGGELIPSQGLLESARLENSASPLGLTDLLEAMSRRAPSAFSSLESLSPFASVGNQSAPPPRSSGINPGGGIGPVSAPLNPSVPNFPTDSSAGGSAQQVGVRSDDGFGAFNALTLAPLSASSFAVRAEGTVYINGSSDFDGAPLNPNDDALLYGGNGFTINGRTKLPVQRDITGNPITDAQGRPILVDNAVAVSENYAVFNVSNNSYSNLQPSIVSEQDVEVPNFSELLTQTLAAKVPAGTIPVSFNPQQYPLNNQNQWEQYFPAGGTPEQPTYVQITSSGFNVPNGVTIENTIIELQNGYLNFNGSGHQLKNVTLVTRHGGVNLGNIQGTDLTVLSSQSINMNGGARFGGESLLATGTNQSIQFNGATQTTDPSDFLTVISQGDIAFNGQSDTRGQFLSRGNFTFNGNSTLYGSIDVEWNVFFNGNATVVGIAPSNIAPSDLTLSPAVLFENVDAGTVVGQLSTVDVNTADAHTYALASGNGDVDNTAFTIEGNQLRINVAPDFEAEDSYSIRVRSTDDGGLSVEKVLTISISNVNEAPVLSLQNSVTRLPEDTDTSSRVKVADIAVTDDALGSTTLSLSGTDVANFEIDGTQLFLKAGTVLDFETKPQFEITVAVDDATIGINPEDTVTYTLAISDVEEGIVLREGTAFETIAQETVTIPSDPAVLVFTYDPLSFDSSDPEGINDALEVALVDLLGNGLTHTIQAGSDAFFNATEGQPVVLAPGVTQAGQTVSVNLTGLVAGPATLIFRLVNNDSDTETLVRITSIEVQASDGTPVPGVTPEALASTATSGPMDFAQLADVSASLTANYQQTSFNDETNVLFADLGVRNAGTYGVDGPLLVVIDHISDPIVQVLEADGITPTGLPYYDFSAQVTGGTLNPGEQSEIRTIQFLNPTGEQFSYELVFLGQLNVAPEFVSEPDVEALAGQSYIYDAEAIDLNGDSLTYSLLSGPEGMTINSATGEITGSPTTDEIGTYTILVQVEDGRGGITQQAYTLAVIAPPPIYR